MNDSDLLSLTFEHNGIQYSLKEAYADGANCWAIAVDKSNYQIGSELDWAFWHGHQNISMTVSEFEKTFKSRNCPMELCELQQFRDFVRDKLEQSQKLEAESSLDGARKSGYEEAHLELLSLVEKVLQAKI